ncbi:MAG: apolipoprotein N-acyltransferase [Elusimicrobiota bacterium]
MTHYLLAVVSGVLLTLSFEPFRLWPLAFIAWVPLWHAMLKAPDMRSAANLAGVAGLVFYSVSLHWLMKVFGPMVVAFWCVFALGPAAHAAVLWRLKDRLSPMAWVFAGAVLWVGIEYFRCEVWFLNNSWLALGYSQVPNLPLLQVCGVIGLYGLSGLIAAVNLGLVLALRKRWAPACAAVGLVLLGTAFGAWRMRGPDQGEPLAVAAVQDENYDLDGLIRLSLAPEARGAKLIVWPEYGFTVQPDQQAQYTKFLRGKLKDLAAVKVVGAAVFPEDPKKEKMQNFAWVFSPEGELLGRYDKHHPIPYVERHLPANKDPRPVDTPLGKLGVQICYDLDFEDGTRKIVRQGARILVVPNLDPREWGHWEHAQHSTMSCARAVESGLWIVRAASSGYSQIIDRHGRVRAVLKTLDSGTLVGEARLVEGGTPYSAAGWLLAPLCLLGALGIAGVAVKNV